MHFVNDGTVLIGDRGAGRRPRRPPSAVGGAQAVFVGTAAPGEAREAPGEAREAPAVARRAAWQLCAGAWWRGVRAAP